MRKKSGILEVARQAGVSSASVSRALSGHPAVSDNMKARVLAAAADLGFHPNQMAQGLRRGRSTTVGLLVGDIEQGVYASLTKEIQAALETLGLDLLLYNLGHSHDRLKNILARSDSLQLHGIIIAASDTFSEDNLAVLSRKAAEQHFPILAIGLSLHEQGIPSIVYDDSEAVMRSVTHLIATRGPGIAYLGRIGGSASGTKRFSGYKAALAAHGIQIDQRLVWDAAFRYRAGHDSVERALDMGWAFRAIQAGSDELALGAMAALNARGLRIPEDVAIVGIGNIESAAYSSPSLTTHGAAPEAIARLVAERLKEWQSNGIAGEVITLSRPFIRRASA
jgi:DNA-binding LacI/PurR family transcriptional regulator